MKLSLKMDEESFQTNLNTLKEMVLDEQKLVTYVSISKDLCIHINDSKRLLTKFVEDLKNKQPGLELNVCFIVSGLTEDNKARTTVVSEAEIDDIKKRLKIVFFDHIYSVNKGLPAVDSVAYLAVNKFEDFLLCTGLIKSRSCVKRSSDEIGNLKSNSQGAIQVEQKPATLPLKKVKEESSKLVTNGFVNSKNVTKVHESKSEPSIKTELPSPKKDIASSSKPKIDFKKNGVKSQKGIAGFFNKSNSVPSKILSKDVVDIKKEVIVKKEPEPVPVKKEPEPVPVKKEPEPVPVKKEPEPVPVKKEVEKMDVDIETPVKEDVKQKDIKQKDKKVDTKKEQVNGKSKNKSLTQIKKTAKVDKKRKRVLHVSDSDDDDPFADEPEVQAPESDDEIPPTPATNTVKITSGIVNPKKKRKTVDKTYTDEEGYILTKKVEVYESCSDNEEEIPKENVVRPHTNKIKVETTPQDKKAVSKNSKKKISPPQKGKQATMMNFFKKV